DRLIPPKVTDHQLHTRNQEWRLAGPGDQLVVGNRRVLGEDLTIGPEPDSGAGDSLANPPSLRQSGPGSKSGACVIEDSGCTPLEGHLPRCRRPVDLHVEPRAKGVDYRASDAMQSAGCDVRAAAELATRMELAEDDLNS